VAALALAAGPAYAQHSEAVVGPGDSIQATVDAAAAGQSIAVLRGTLQGQRRDR
jgi:hypothetical protein